MNEWVKTFAVERAGGWGSSGDSFAVNGRSLARRRQCRVTTLILRPARVAELGAKQRQRTATCRLRFLQPEQYQLNDLEQWWLSASLFSPLDMSGTGTGASKTRAAPDARNILASTGHTGWRCGWPNVNQCWVTLLLLHICYLGQFLFSESGSRSTKHYTGTLPVTVAGNKSN